jgi:hypothetical protein
MGQGQRADEQLEGAVAIHNILEQHGVAYLADEVGMGKTYVALGALALFRHYNPDFRVLVIAPRENIQTKWMKELRNFVAYNVAFPDLRIKACDGEPVRPLINCGNLLDLVRESSVCPDRDFFVRLSSFSVAMSGRDDTVDIDAARRLRDGFRKWMPWIRDEVFDLRNKQEFKDNVARMVCCSLSPFDLVIVDEGHHLKHGLGEHVAARNRVLSLAMGYQVGGTDPSLFPGYGPRARRVLFLSATPVEESYRHLWNQLSVFGCAGPFAGLADVRIEENEKKAIAAQFLIRRVTRMRIDGHDYTKNLYRREWRRGGLRVHDEPITVEDPRQRLIVALVQKKVGELLGHERFNSSFQIGMLASFESFLETARLKRDDTAAANFDDSEQAKDFLEKEGIDVADINRLGRSYRKDFGRELPHPKMDAVVDSLSRSWTLGRKALIFVRRVASVKELKRKLDELYDQWIFDRLLTELPVEVLPRFRRVFEQYRREKLESDMLASGRATDDESSSTEEDIDSGGKDTFFAWFFRGEGPKGVVSGANIQQRFIQRGAVYSTFFEDNYVAGILGCSPAQAEEHLLAQVKGNRGELRERLRIASRRFLSRARKHARADRFEAVQAAAIELLKDHVGPHQSRARIVWQERFEPSVRVEHAVEAPEIGDWLTLPTFFTALREREALRSVLWPISQRQDPVEAFRESELRGQLLASAARLGHALIDLYVMTIRRLRSLEPRVQEAADDVDSATESVRIAEYLDLLEGQRVVPRADRAWAAYDELADIAKHFDLLLDVNEPDARNLALSEGARKFGRLLRQQRPVGGMSGQVNETLVRQFRMPGYPLVLISTDLLQEGEDLHTFCASVHHYGIAWTPSSMEQRIGRIDRVRSLTERILSTVSGRDPSPEERLQVYFPHLEDTVEILQVRRVLERMNIFLRLMHEGLTTAAGEEKSIDTTKDFARGLRLVPQILDLLESAFPVRPAHLRGGERALAVSPTLAKYISGRFSRISTATLPGVNVRWNARSPANACQLRGFTLNNDDNPLQLYLQSFGSRQLIRCVLSFNRLGFGDDRDGLFEKAAIEGIRLAVAAPDEKRAYDLTIEGDILLGERSESDSERVAALIRRVLHQWELLKSADGVRPTERSPGNPAKGDGHNPESFDWPIVCRAKDLSINDPYVEVILPDGRRQSVCVERDGDSFRLSTFVAKQALVAALSDLPLQTWIRNSHTHLVGFRMDRKRRLVAEAWIPNVGLTPEDVRFYLRVLAQAADRFEYALTGKDAE